MPKKKKMIFTAEMILLAIILCLVFLFLTDSFVMFFSVLYSPLAFAIAFLMGLEYIIIKVLDNSRMQKLQYKVLRRKRKKSIAMNRELVERLDKMEKRLDGVKSIDEFSTLKKDIEWMKKRIKSV